MSTRIVLCDSRPSVTSVTLPRGADGDSLYHLSPHGVALAAGRIRIPNNQPVSAGNNPSTRHTRRHNRG